MSHVMSCRFTLGDGTTANPRSADFGSPQYRRRLYIIGAREDVADDRHFKAAIEFFKDSLPSVHTRAGIRDVVAFIRQLRAEQPVVHAPCEPLEAWQI